MRREAIIFVTLIMAGCSSARISQSANEPDKRSGVESLEDIMSLNLTNNNFQIQKASLEIVTESGTEKLMASMKYRMPGTYLISLRSTAGIEAARFYITNDTILVNDRINRKLFHASPLYLEEKYGVSTAYLPVIIGDLVGNMNNSEKIECINGEYSLVEKTGRDNIEFTVSCRNGKVSEVITGNIYSGNRIIVEFSRLRSAGNLNYPGDIYIRHTGGKESVRLIIERINSINDEEIVFIPGRNYEDVVLR